jgi:hypothetical protein
VQQSKRAAHGLRESAGRAAICGQEPFDLEPQLAVVAAPLVEQSSLLLGVLLDGQQEKTLDAPPAFGIHGHGP